jgi:hypothetical protein
MQNIQYVDIELLKPLERNPRKITEHQMGILCDNLKNHPRFFEARPILCNKDMVVFAGNMRLNASKIIGLKQVPVQIMDIDDEEQRQLVILDNRTNGENDMDILSADYDVSELIGLGFDERELLGNILDPVEKDEDETGTSCEECDAIKAQKKEHKKETGHKI